MKIVYLSCFDCWCWYNCATTTILASFFSFSFFSFSGCSLQLGDASGTVVSPGYLIQGANYPANQTCSYDVVVPGLQTATLIFSAVDIHPSDEIKVGTCSSI